jgi:hypothetical protein
MTHLAIQDNTNHQKKITANLNYSEQYSLLSELQNKPPQKQRWPKELRPTKLGAKWQNFYGVLASNLGRD